MSQIFRAVPRLGAQRSSVFRNAVQRRFNSETKNAFIREREAIEHHAGQTTELWRKICIYTVPPSLVLAGVNAWIQWNEHWEHWEHMPPLEERTEYPYQNIRTKNFPWGDGDKTIFWNENVNYHNQDKQK